MTRNRDSVDIDYALESAELVTSLRRVFKLSGGGQDPTIGIIDDQVEKIESLLSKTSEKNRPFEWRLLAAALRALQVQCFPKLGPGVRCSTLQHTDAHSPNRRLRHGYGLSCGSAAKHRSPCHRQRPGV